MDANRHECAAGIHKTRKTLAALRASVPIRVHARGNKTKTGHRTGHQTGLWAETLAALALMLKGYAILARRYKTPLGEIDLVARRGRTIAFVEVKWRASRDEAVEAVHAKNRARVRNAAALYLQKHPQYAGFSARFDAMALGPKAWPRHIPNAWQ